MVESSNKYLSELLNQRLMISDTKISGVTCDSRKVKQGFLYFALPGMKQNGHEFINDAIKNGASVVVVCDRNDEYEIPSIYISKNKIRNVYSSACFHFFADQTKGLRIIGVTGTNGKSTTSWIIRELLMEASLKVGLIGTVFNSTDGVNLSRANLTTPIAEELHLILSKMKSVNCDWVVMEVSSIAMDQSRVEGIDFTAGCFTNLTRDHLNYHKTFRAYKKSKQQFFKSLNPTALAVLNADDSFYSSFSRVTAANKLSFGRGLADIVFDVKDFGLNEMQITFKVKEDVIDFKTNLIGDFNASNIVQALTCLIGLGFDVKNLIPRLSKIQGLPGRMEKFILDGRTVFVDFAHTSDGLKKVLASLKRLKEKNSKIITVFGGGGGKKKKNRILMGRALKQYSDSLVLTNDNPRDESPQKIIEEITKGMNDLFQVHIELNRKKAIRKAILISDPGDIILIAGKGHEKTQSIKGRVLPFSDQNTLISFGAKRG